MSTYFDSFYIDKVELMVNKINRKICYILVPPLMFVGVCCHRHESSVFLQRNKNFVRLFNHFNHILVILYCKFNNNK